MKKLAAIFVGTLMISVTAVAAPVSTSNTLDSVPNSSELNSKEPKKTKTNGGIHIRF